MKTRLQPMLVLMLALLMALSLSACGGSGGDSASSTAAGQSNAYSNDTTGSYYEKSASIASSGNMDVSTEDEAAVDETSGFDSESAARDNRKLITTVYVDAETEDFDSFTSWMDEAVDSAYGYIEKSDFYTHSVSSRSCDLTLRIPADKLDGFLKEMAAVCNILQQSTNEEDVTLSYVDTESHRDALLVEQSRLLELLERAESLEDIISLEDRLTEVRYQLQNYESALRVYDNQINYSTVNLFLREVRELTEPEPETWGSRAISGMRENARDIGRFFQELGLFIVVHLPTFLLLGVIAVVVLLCTTKHRREAKLRRKQQKELLNAMKQQPPQNPNDNKQ